MAVNLDILIDALDQSGPGTDSAKRNVKSLGVAADTAQRGFSGLQNAVGFGLKAAAGIGVAGIGALGFALRDSIGLARTQINAEKQLEAVLKSTGGAAGLTADELKAMASELQGVTNFGDEATIAGQSLLLTFTNIGKDVFPRATETMLDMSQALGQDMKSSAVQLGKALNDPIKGLTALSRVGVSFTEEQEEQIKAMAEAGDVAGAQGLILDELARQFGGSARALADPAIQLSNAWGDFKEVLGAAVIPVVNNLAQRALPIVNRGIETLSGFIESFTGKMDEGFSVLGAFKVSLFEAFGNNQITQTISSIIDFVSDLTTAIGALFGGEVFEDEPAWVQAFAAAGNVIRPIVTQVIDAITQFVSWKDIMIVLGAVIASIIIPALVSVLTAAAPVVATFAALTAGTALLRNAWEKDFGGIQGKTQNVFRAVRNFITSEFGFVVDWWNENLPLMRETVDTIWGFITGIFKGSGGEIMRLVRVLGTTLVRSFQTFLHTILDLVTAIMQLITGDFEGFQETIRGIWERIADHLLTTITTLGPALLDAFVAIINGIINAFSNVDWIGVGSAIINGIVSGVQALAGVLAETARSAAEGAYNAMTGWLGIRSPSTRFAEVGDNMMRGLTQGIQRSAVQTQAAAVSAARQTTTVFQAGAIPINVQMPQNATRDNGMVTGARVSGALVRSLRTQGLPS